MAARPGTRLLELARDGDEEILPGVVGDELYSDGQPLGAHVDRERGGRLSADVELTGEAERLELASLPSRGSESSPRRAGVSANTGVTSRSKPSSDQNEITRRRYPSSHKSESQVLRRGCRPTECAQRGVARLVLLRSDLPAEGARPFRERTGDSGRDHSDEMTLETPPPRAGRGAPSRRGARSTRVADRRTRTASAHSGSTR